MNRSKQKGTAGETAVVDYLRQHPRFAHVERRTLSGVNDRGDIAGIPGVVIEVKNCAEMKLAEWIDEELREASNDGDSLGVVWHKRRMKSSPGDWYVTMTGRQFVDLLGTALHALDLSADDVVRRINGKAA